jgi:hypothetical protein
MNELAQYRVWLVSSVTLEHKTIPVYASSRAAAMLKAENQHKDFYAVDAE